jgi:FkbM family methyltransferase
MLIFDVGFYDGEDTRYYLAKGARVVAFEAHPALFEAGKKRFAEAIKHGQLSLHNLAIAGHSGQVEMFMHRDGLQFSTVSKEVALAWPKEKLDKIITVQAITGAQLYEQFGIPDYVKIDIELLDIEVIRPLKDLKIRPTFVSAEFQNLLVLVELLRAGYDAFKIVDQAKIPGSVTRVGGENFTLSSGSSGPVSDETPGEWLSFHNVSHLYTNLHANPFKTVLPPGHWWDVHAAIGQQASTHAQLRFMRDLMDEYTQAQLPAATEAELQQVRAAKDATEAELQQVRAAKDAAEAELQGVRTLKEQNAALEKALSGLRDSKTWKLAAPLWRLETHGRRKAERQRRSTN